VPEVLVFVLLSPIMFVLLFAYVFGSDRHPGRASYREFLIAGIFAQTVVFGATFTGAGIAEDMQKGIIDRFRSLPMSRSAVLAGGPPATSSTTCCRCSSWRSPAWSSAGGSAGSMLDAVAGFAAAAAVRLRLLVGHGLRRAARPERRGDQQRLVHGDLPADVRGQHLRAVENLPGPLRTFAEWNPVSAVTQAARELFGNIPAGTPPSRRCGRCRTRCSTRVAIFLPLSVRRYTHAR
jgi:ABC-2 type transport system permease protein